MGGHRKAGGTASGVVADEACGSLRATMEESRKKRQSKYWPVRAEVVVLAAPLGWSCGSGALVELECAFIACPDESFRRVSYDALPMLELIRDFWGFMKVRKKILAFAYCHGALGAERPARGGPGFSGGAVHLHLVLMGACDAPSEAQACSDRLFDQRRSHGRSGGDVAARRWL